ncbi:MAG: MauE/DoxX family redox-associated membrane protein [Ginsengibacter sp.]
MKKRIPDIISGLLILLFVYAAASKLFDYEQSGMQLSRSPVIGDYAGVLAWLVPAMELLIAGMLTILATRLTGLYASLLLLLAFTGYIAGMLFFQEHLPCSCGGVIALLSWKQHLFFSLFFIGLSGFGIVVLKKEKKLNSQKIFRANKKEGS